MIKIQSLLLLFFINVCFSQHIHENIQWNNSTEPENENKNSIIGVFNNFYVDYEKEKFSNSYFIFETHHFKNKLSDKQGLELVNLISILKTNIIEIIDVKAKSKGKGFAGTIKRYNFARQDATHGNKHTERAPGSIGQASWPSRVFKGMRMAGRMGSDNVTVKNLEIVDIDNKNNLLFIKGAIPGANNSPVFLLKK